MKARNGFVSNSSSSSFVIGIPKGNSLEETLDEYFGIENTKGIIHEMAKAVVDSFVRNTEEVFEDLPELISWINRYGRQREFSEYELQLIELVKKGFTVYYGSISDEWDSWDRSVDMWLCYTSVNVDEPGLYIEHEGGY